MSEFQSIFSKSWRKILLLFVDTVYPAEEFTLTDASDTGHERLAYTSKWTLSKKTLNECKQKPNSISTKYEKTSYLKFFHLSLVSLTAVINLYFRIFPGETDFWKKPEVKNFLLDSL